MDKLCSNCARRARCINLGWLSPSGFWFPDQVVIRPEPGCQLHDVGGDTVMRQIGIVIDRATAPAEAGEDRVPAKAAE